WATSCDGRSSPACRSYNRPMDLTDLMDLIFTSEDDLRKLGAQGGPEARKLVEDAVAATKKARGEAGDAVSKLVERFALVKRSELEALAKRVSELEHEVRKLKGV